MVTVLAGKATSWQCYEKLFRVLSELLGVKFSFGNEYDGSERGPLVLLDCPEATLQSVCTSDVRFIVYGTPRNPLDIESGNVVMFSSSESLPKTLRGQSMLTREVRGLGGFRHDELMENLAEIGGVPVWTTRRGKIQHYTSVSLPKDDEYTLVSAVFNGETFLRVLPLYCFLQSCAEKGRRRVSTPRACVVIDDPNLHWTSYGPVSFGSLAGYCRQRDVHMAFATVPLDGWHVERRVANLFNQNRKHLSLSIHGNNHIAAELLQPLQPDEALAYYGQALYRIEKMEARFGLSIDRVMIPPHGVLGKSLAPILLSLGFEAICTNRWSFWKHNDPSGTHSIFGVEPASIIGGGIPVLNRFRLVSPIFRNEVIVAALLGMPIVPYCHIEDFRESMRQIEDGIDFIDEIGGVYWQSLSRIMDTNYVWFAEEDVLCLKLYSLRVKVTIPAGVRLISILFDSGSERGEEVFRAIVKPLPQGEEREYCLRERISVIECRDYEIRVRRPDPLQAQYVRKGRTSYSALLRRMGTELRDRLLK